MGQSEAADTQDTQHQAPKRMADWTVGFAFCFGSCCFTKLPDGYVSAQPKALEGGNIPLHPIRRLQISVKESQLRHILVNICNTKENPMVHSTNSVSKQKSQFCQCGSYFLLSLKLLAKFHGHLSVGREGSMWTEPHCFQVPANHGFGKRGLQEASDGPQKASKDAMGASRPGYWLGTSGY